MSDAATSPPATRPGRLRPWLLRLVVLAFAVGFCLVFLELGVRMALPFFRPQAQVPFHMHTNGVAVGIPNQTVRVATPKGDFDLQFRFNENGFRDSKNLRESTPTDWFALGDSYTMGWGVQEGERFSSRLEELWRTNAAPARIFNIAVPENIVGYQRLLAYAQSCGAPVHRLIIGICMENDLCDYTNPRSAGEVDAGVGEPARPSSVKERVRSLLKEHSALYLATSYCLQKTSFTRRLLEKAGVARDIQTLVGYNTYDETVLRTSRDQLVKLVAGRQAVVLIIPSRNLWHGPHQDEENKVHEAFVRLVREAGLPVVDPRPALEKQGNPLDCYFKTDPHWNPRGHEIAARELSAWFQTNNAPAR